MEQPSVQILVVVANIQVETLEGRGRRRVPCQQQMDMGESALRDGGNLLHTNRRAWFADNLWASGPSSVSADSNSIAHPRSKGKPAKIPAPCGGERCDCHEAAGRKVGGLVGGALARR